MDSLTKARLRWLKYYAERLNGMSVPDLSPAELERVLQWKMIPTNAMHIYEYAMCANGFRVQLSNLDHNVLDAKTQRLVISTLHKIGFGEPEGPRYNELFARLAGILSVNLVCYFATTSTLIFMILIGSAIPLIISTRSMLKVIGAKNRRELRLGYQEEKAFQDASWMSVTGMFFTEACVPALACLWKLMKLHPWLGCTAIPILAVIWNFLTNPVVQDCCLDILLKLRFRSAMFLGWVEFGLRYALDAILHFSRMLAQALRPNVVITWLLQLGHGEQQAEKKESFVYPADFQHDKKNPITSYQTQDPVHRSRSRTDGSGLKPMSLPQYHAISHVWSHCERNRTIILNGRPFPITSSDYNILCKSSSYSAPRTIWIDTICINQRDGVEKASQIKKNARYLLQCQILRAYGASKSDCSAIMTEMLLRKKNDKWVRARIDSLLELLSNEWFERTWVIQEFVTARHVVVNYGKHSFNWTKFTLLAQMIEDEEVPEVAQCLMSGGNHSGARLKSWVKRPVRLEEWRGRLLNMRLDDIHEILATFQSCKATQWQDKVFALIGFSESANRLSSLIDYQLPKDKVLLEVAHHIDGMGNLMETFPFAGLSLLPTYPTNIPSWVADWTVSRDIDPILAGHNRKYDASKEENARISNGASRNEITVSSVLFDAIKKISEVDLNFTPDAGTLQSNPKLIDSVLQYFASAMDLARRECTDPYQPLGKSSVPLDEAVSRTMIGDAVELLQPIIWDYQNLVSRFLDHGQSIKQALEQGKFKFNNIHPLPQSYGAYEKETERELQVGQLMKDIENARWLCGGQDTRRKFGVTGKGCIGIVPRKALVGDLICILYGSTVPMVLRKMPSYDSYQLVGEAYVHGIMDGEGLESAVKMRFNLR
ncbi:hypothetical protein LTR70_007385 [Exophiala xenobiotica]|uniref:Heterokaryon incompatibility domain-containing protein n=1 Tax=Lithohypha guttulata TaxID=1690604 RepID=A0ABR0K4K0_9EURO|nr:hypothetical protein LTR24_006887 [Lithohypha guttulata]KAK5313963.1 hypothetical protein LTR70_007385 [Exophiala xenobiotica]